MTELAEPAAQLPAKLAAPCADPAAIPKGALNAGPGERLWFGDRAALLDCGLRKSLAQEFYAKLLALYAGKK